MKFLIILNDAPYGAERSYNALRVAKSLLAHNSDELTLFLMSDAVTCAKDGQKPPSGYYNIELMLKAVARYQGSRILLCGSCMDARGLTKEQLIGGAWRSNMDALSKATVDADKVLVF